MTAEIASNTMSDEGVATLEKNGWVVIDERSDPAGSLPEGVQEKLQETTDGGTITVYDDGWMSSSGSLSDVPFDPSQQQTMEILNSTGGDVALLGAVVAGVVVATSVIVLVSFVLRAIGLMKFLKNVGHPKPWAAWVPFLSMATLYQMAGIERRWLWVLAPLGLSALSLIPAIGWIFTIASLAASLLLLVWAAKGVHAGLEMKSTGGIVLAVLLLPIWALWIGSRSKGVEYNADAAYDSGQGFVLNKIGANKR